jgi:hypothetical protein
MKTLPSPNLSRTAAAIEAYDAFDATYDALTPLNNETVLAWFAKLEEMGKAVGHAFGLDTADRNSLSTCEGCIRPGHKVPGPGCELSFVRRMVAKWQEKN